MLVSEVETVQERTLPETALAHPKKKRSKTDIEKQKAKGYLRKELKNKLSKLIYTITLCKLKLIVFRFLYRLTIEWCYR